MATVPVRINGKEYQIACDDGQEEHLRTLAFDFDDRINQLAYQMGGNPGEVMGMLLAGLMMADETIENRKEIERLSKEVRALTKAAGTRAPESMKLSEVEHVMMETLSELANRIEKMADQVELR